MTNLLPPKEIEKLSLEQNKRLVIVLGSIVLIFLICLILVLSSINFYISGETNYQKYLLEQTEKQYQGTDFLDFKNVIQKYNKILIQLKVFYGEKIYFNDILKTISGIEKPEGLYLTDLSLNRGETNKIKVIVAGFSDTRENLLIFKKNIEREGKIKNPNFSSESWVNPKNINFYLTFEVSENGNQK